MQRILESSIFLLTLVSKECTILWDQSNKISSQYQTSSAFTGKQHVRWITFWVQLFIVWALLSSSDLATTCKNKCNMITQFLGQIPSHGLARRSSYFQWIRKMSPQAQQQWLIYSMNCTWMMKQWIWMKKEHFCDWDKFCYVPQHLQNFMLIHFYNYIALFLPHFPQILKQELHCHNYWQLTYNNYLPIPG